MGPPEAGSDSRLIGTFARSTIAVGGTWSPQFGLTKPVTEVKMTIRSTKTGSTLRVLTGTGPDGSIRDLVFDGCSGAGKKLAAGTYSWQLTANAKDGEGALISIRGESKVSGTIRVG